MIHYSKHKSLEIPNLFKLSVAKFMYNFYGGGLPTHIEDYFAEIASVQKYHIRRASLQTYYLQRMKTSLVQISIKYNGLNIWSNTPENLKASSPGSFGKEYKNILQWCQNFCWSSLYMLVTFCYIVFYATIFAFCRPLHLLTPPTLRRHAFPSPFFVCCFFNYFTWHWFDDFISYSQIAKRPQIKFGLY